MSNTERRWSKWEGHYLYYWVDNRCQIVISLRTLKVSVTPNSSPLKDEEISDIIDDKEAKQILLELFNKKYTKGFIPIKDLVIKPQHLVIVDDLVYNYGRPFLNLTTGEWAEGVEESPTKGIIKEAQRQASKDVTTPKVVRDGVVKSKLDIETIDFLSEHPRDKAQELFDEIFHKIDGEIEIETNDLEGGWLTNTWEISLDLCEIHIDELVQTLQNIKHPNGNHNGIIQNVIDYYCQVRDELMNLKEPQPTDKEVDADEQERIIKAQEPPEEDIKYLKRYSQTNKPDDKGRWARIATFNDIQIAWISRIEANSRVVFSVSCDFPTRELTDTPNEHNHFDTYEEAQKWVSERWEYFLSKVSTSKADKEVMSEEEWSVENIKKEFLNITHGKYAGFINNTIAANLCRDFINKHFNHLQKSKESKRG